MVKKKRTQLIKKRGWGLLIPFYFFKMKTINVDDDVWERLHKLKMKYKFRSINNFINVMSKVIKKFKPELEDLK